ncbi:MAG: hypothetical protein Q9M36_03815 [Sulfurovum sp.]|nr:hypothetical protein [Sulfurovum sp.]
MSKLQIKENINNPKIIQAKSNGGLASKKLGNSSLMQQKIPKTRIPIWNEYRSTKRKYYRTT